MCSCHDGIVSGLYKKIRIIGGLDVFDAIYGRQGRDIVIGQTECGNDADIIKVGIVHICLHRFLHVDRCCIQTGKKADTKCNDGKNGDKSAFRMLKGSSYIFAVASGHFYLILSRKLLPFNLFYRCRMLIQFLFDNFSAADADHAVSHGGKCAVVGDDDNGTSLFSACLL